MIVRDFNVGRPCFRPFETNPILVVNADTVLAFSVSVKRLQLIAGRRSEFVKRGNGIKLIKFSRSDFPNIFRADFQSLFRGLAIKNILRRLILEPFYHGNTIARLSCYFKRTIVAPLQVGQIIKPNSETILLPEFGPS